MAKKTTLNRRTFLSTAAAASAFTLLPHNKLFGADAPSKKLRVAGVGAGGQAMHDLGQVSRWADIVALCDVDDERSALAKQRWPEATVYRDWRIMLEKEQNNIDAVVVACPDHMHAVAAMAAMQLGKHVYVEKPMAHNIAEVRALRAMAKKTGVVTQMGNQGHSFPGVHRLKKWMELDAIGTVSEVQCWTNRPSWPQGIPRPADTPPVPETLDWDLWLGPAAKRPYNPAYCPRSWRGWADFGTGALGDMGCHILDSPFYALDLGNPTRVSSEADPFNGETFQKKTKITYEFPARGAMPPVKLVWHDGGSMPERPEELEDDRPIGDNEGGSLFIGSKGKMVSGTYSNNAKIIPTEKHDNYEHNSINVFKSKGHHYDWVHACMGEGSCASHFDYAAGLTEMVLLGTIALRAKGPIEWDTATMSVTNDADANELVSREYLNGYSLG